MPTAQFEIDLTAERVQFVDVGDLDKHTADGQPLEDCVKRIIQEGHDPLDGELDGKPKTDRSLWVFDVACALVRRGVPDNVSHDDGQDHEQRVGHMHGHVDFDHSHDLGVRQDLRCIARPPRTNDWSILAGNCLPLDILAGLDRPPRVDGRSIPACQAV